MSIFVSQAPDILSSVPTTLASSREVHEYLSGLDNAETDASHHEVEYAREAHGPHDGVKDISDEISNKAEGIGNSFAMSINMSILIYWSPGSLKCELFPQTTPLCPCPLDDPHPILYVILVYNSTCMACNSSVI